MDRIFGAATRLAWTDDKGYVAARFPDFAAVRAQGWVSALWVRPRGAGVVVPVPADWAAALSAVLASPQVRVAERAIGERLLGVQGGAYVNYTPREKGTCLMSLPGSVPRLSVRRDVLRGALQGIYAGDGTGAGSRVDVPLIALPGVAAYLPGALARAFFAQALIYHTLERKQRERKDLRNSVEAFVSYVASKGLLREEYDPYLVYRVALMRFLPYQLETETKLSLIVEETPSRAKLPSPALWNLSANPEESYNAQNFECLRRVEALVAELGSVLANYFVPVGSFPATKRMIAEARVYTAGVKGAGYAGAKRGKGEPRERRVPNPAVRKGLLANMTLEQKCQWWVERAARMREARRAKRAEKLGV